MRCEKLTVYIANPESLVGCAIHHKCKEDGEIAWFDARVLRVAIFNEINPIKQLVSLFDPLLTILFFATLTFLKVFSFVLQTTLFFRLQVLTFFHHFGPFHLIYLWLYLLIKCLSFYNL
jgi:hypothetical protein